jgi:hypothetical protein
VGQSWVTGPVTREQLVEERCGSGRTHEGRLCILLSTKLAAFAVGQATPDAGRPGAQAELQTRSSHRTHRADRFGLASRFAALWEEVDLIGVVHALRRGPPVVRHAVVDRCKDTANRHAQECPSARLCAERG